MDDSARLKRALGDAVPEAPPADPAADLARARTARRDRSRRRLRLGLSGLALAVVAAVGVAGVVDRTRSGDPSGSEAGAAITLVDTTLHARPYSFDLTPEGWSVQARSAYVVTIVPDHGHTSPNPYVFVGKLVITFDHEPPSGQLLTGTGDRAIWVHADAGYTAMSMRTTGGEPRGVVQIQYPDDAGWDRASMARFLLSVHVGPGARASQG